MSTGSLAEVLRGRAERERDRVGYVFLTDGETAAESVTYGELDARAGALAATLREHDLTGRPVMLAHTAGLEFVAAFFGCLYARAIPVAVHLPAPGPEAHSRLDRFRAVAADVEPAAVVGSASGLARIPAELRETMDAVSWIAQDQDQDQAVTGAGSGRLIEPSPPHSDLAYLQYTSGSTSRPRAAMIGHRALLEQLERYRLRAGLDWRESVMVGWLPHQHDFGLVGFLLSSIYMGVPYYFMSPAHFLRRPMRWLEAIGRFGGTYSGAPTFAYALCARASGTAPPQALDLRSWSIASVGAEPIAADVLERFARRFAPHGFDRAAFLATYGLAEAVLCVTARHGVAAGGIPARQNGSERAPRVSVGSPLPGQTVRIVDPETRIECAPGEIGEIWIGGASLASGYWRAPAETERNFKAALADSGAGPFLRSGDLGFVVDGELFVADRLKDLIIVRGENHHPHDIELTAQATDPALRRGRGAVFQDGPAGEQRLVLVNELARGVTAVPSDLVARTRAAVAEAHGLDLSAVELIEPGSLPRTASGKISRHAARAAWRAGELRVIGRMASVPRSNGAAASIERDLAAIWSDVLGVAHVSPDDDLFALGGDSLATFRIAGAVSERLGVELPIRALFERRTVARLARYIATAPRGRTAIAPEPDGDLTHLSAGQREILALAALGPDAEATFHVMTVLTLTEAADEPALRRALATLVERHDSLRTVLAPDRLHTHVLAEVQVQLTALDLASADLVDWLRDERLRPFDLTGVPPWRAFLLRGDPTVRLVLTAHHLIADGASLRELADELRLCYADARAGRTSRLAPPMQPGDYWQLRKRLVTPDAMATHEAYWRDELGGEFAALELPSDRPRSSTPTFAGANHTIVLDQAVRARIERLAQQCGCTLFVALLTAYIALLHRLSGQDDLLLTFASDGRHVPGSHTVIGACSTDLPLRSQLTGDPTVADRLAEVSEQVLGSLEHQDYTLAMLLEQSRAPIDARRPLRVTTALNLQTLAPCGEPFAVDLELQAKSVTRCLLDLELNAVDTGAEIRLDFTHNTSLLDGAAVARIAAYYRSVVDAMASDASAKLGSLSILSADEERLLLDDWGSGGEGDGDVGIDRFADLFDSRVAQAPNAIAVVDDERAMTYAELGAGADAVAATLLRDGSAAGGVTALLARRGCGLLAAMLGVLRVGGALLLLDPRDPDLRLGEVVARSGAAVIVAGPGFEAMAARLVEAHADPAPRLLLLADALHDDRGRTRSVAVGHRSPAYVIFTSGSTGPPKGATVAHAGLLNHLRSKIATLGLTAADTVAQTAPQSFDIAIWQFLAPLLVGAAVRVIADAATHDPVKLLTAVDREQIAILETVPSTLRALLDSDVQRAAGRPRLRGLRWLIATGEALPPALCRRWLSHYPAVPVLNAYGPSECSDDVTHQVIEWPPAADSRRVPIGRPIPGARVYVCDTRGGLGLLGAPGELYVGGVCVGLGYVNDPELTARAFVPDPFVAGATLYRTGDLVRWRVDGTLEFLGRIDDQEQLQGVRIEPGEIEAVLSCHPAVRECAVAVRRGGDAAKVLAAYVALRPGTAPPNAELRYFLRARLPQHMVPSTITIVDAVPVGANGKVDRKALPAPSSKGRAHDDARIAPRTAIERDIAAIWAQTLERRDFGVHDDLFELGGRSLDAAAIASELGRRFGVEFPVFQIYREPSLGGIARFIEDSLREPAWT